MVENNVLQLVSLAVTQFREAGPASADRHPAEEFPDDRFGGQNLQRQSPRPEMSFLAEDVHFAGTALGAEMTVDAPAGNPTQAEVDNLPDVSGMVDQAFFS